ncbi:nucleoside recognition domain-containing protein [Carboxydochorda subterranea]|uniref:Nucleoside recognition domain-containing protein n=1 Tax=Carboxydichorda subterranea TaxID=3109565 RepID=A0ABZ1BXZ4_9FIRM|nr:nucleoside recognition domain-containing protein [Limnochorda sp. L945t]WRP17679.1 nucleoside recognition domain-containing protein [Limnochorda sp. L945t]
MAQLFGVVAAWSVPLLVLAILLLGLGRRVHVYESFVQGARSGLLVGVRVIPYMVAMLAATELFQRSGAMQAVLDPVRPLAGWAGMPVEVLPMALVRPLSGSAASGLLAHLLETHGPDSFVGRLASVMQGSTETTLYVVTVYLGAVGVRDARWALAAGLLADLAGFGASVLAVHLMGWH